MYLSIWLLCVGVYLTLYKLRKGEGKVITIAYSVLGLSALPLVGLCAIEILCIAMKI